MRVYDPSDDSFFFSEFLEKILSEKKFKPKKYLDMGCGSCILSEVVSKFIPKKDILCVDINPNAVKLAKSKNFNAKKSNLFSNIKQKFDLITFNAPYLPEEKQEKKEAKLITTGGKNGDEISIKFIKQAKKHLNKNGKIFLLISSLTPIEKIKKHNAKIAAKKKIWFEELLILEFNLS